MGNRKVKKTIFMSNTLMVLVTLVIFLVINLVIIKVYSEFIEHELEASVEKMISEDSLEVLMQEFTLHRQSFILLFLLDGMLCVGILIIISQFFTRKLVGHIMEPLDALSDGAVRIRADNLTQRIEYEGDEEFENVCSTFNDMQKHILTEREKNKKYEKVRTEMIAGISHDLRTPLTAIRGTVKGLMDGVAKTSEQRDRFLQIAYQRTIDMDALLNQLFYLSKLETGNMPVSLEVLDIVSFIHNYAEVKNSLLIKDQEELTVDTGNIIASIIVDPEQLQRVFDNIFENSRKYAEIKPLKIKIKLLERKDSVCIRFSDNGIGVPDEKIGFLFDEFYRCDESRGQKEGNGLGLYIVKYLVERMNGKVWAENEPEFSVCMEFPLEKKE